MSTGSPDAPDTATEAAECLAAVRRSTEEALTDNELSTLAGIEAFLQQQERGDSADLGTQERYDHAGFVMSSRYRRVVLKELAERSATPSQLDDATDCGMAHISRALQVLAERDLVELLVPEDRKKGRIYGLTNTGEQVLETLAGMERGETA